MGKLMHRVVWELNTIRLIAVVFLLVVWSVCAHAAERHTAALERGFQRPPAQTKPAVYWYWISDNISRDGITRDLEAMARVGIGEAFIGNIFLEDVPAGGVKVLGEEWWNLVEHAVREAGRVGVNIGMFNCPGWSQSGGPWITPDRAMRYLASTELRVQGPERLQMKLERPGEDFQDVALLAFPTPECDAETLSSRNPHIECIPSAEAAKNLVDGNRETQCDLPSGPGTPAEFTVDFVLDEPATVRSITLVPASKPWAAECELFAADESGHYRSLKTFRYDRSNMKVSVGPMPLGPVVASLDATTSRRFRLVFTQITGAAALREIELSAAARVESYVEKQLGKMHPTPLPMWDDYLWSDQPEIEAAELAVPAGRIVDLSSRVDDKGVLRWDVPAGDWIVLRTGMVPTGTRNSPASDEGIGLEVDKMNRDHAKHHLDAFIGGLLRRMPAADRRAFTTVVADSYEQGSQNWTDGFEDVFRKRYGYDPIPWLPTLSGRIVDSADRSNRFLWDLRRLVADRIATEYVGGLRDLCEPHGLQVWLENYGHWGFPAEFLQYGGQSHRIGGEFWTQGSLGSIECRGASSAANIYGFPLVSAEAFTSSPSRFDTAPSDLKARGDWAFCEGINHFVLHVYIHQPWQDRRPGVNAWFGTEFNRHNTWFDASRSWIEYLRPCCFLLQQGTRVADVAYFIGEDSPKMTGIRAPELPPGHDFDYVNAEVILERMTVESGRLVLPHGTSYRLLVLPDMDTMRPELLAKIGALVKGGATVLGRPPKRSPSMEDYPAADERVRHLAAEIWGSDAAAESGSRRYGKGQVVWGESIEEVFAEFGVSPDFASERPLRYTHRTAQGNHIYFVANPEPQPVSAPAAFRAGDRAPSLWRADSGTIERPAAYDVEDDMVRIPLTLAPHESVFVVFGDESANDGRIVTVSRGSETILDAAGPIAESGLARTSPEDTASDFTIAVWANPSADTTIVDERVSGVHGMGDPRNEALVATHGSHLGGEGHAGCGLAIGRNGVCVFEHGANYYAPPLSCETPISGWTHVAVVYRDNRPQLFLDGRLVDTGLQSNHVVHPGSPSPTFSGELGAIEKTGKALTPAEVGDLMRAMRRPDEPLPGSVVQCVFREDGTVEGRFWAPGKYTLIDSQGRSAEANVSGIPQAIAIAGPWEVTFQRPEGESRKVILDTLCEWTSHADEGIRHFSGKAVYRTEFGFPDSRLGAPLILNLGAVHALATVSLNGHQLRTLWTAPWQIDVSEFVRPGKNLLEVEVVNSWHNRLVGDAGLGPDEATTFLLGPTAIGRGRSLQPAGMTGPVTIRAGVDLDLSGE